MPVVVPYVRAKAILADFTAVGGELIGGIVHLYENDYTPNIDSVLLDFTECTFDGYDVSTPIVWSAPWRNALGQAQIVGDTKTEVLDTLPGTIVYGYFVTVAGGLRYAERFPSPVPLAVVDAAVVTVPTYTFGSV